MSFSKSKETDTAIAIGTKLADFTTGSWANFENSEFKLVSINAARFDANKHIGRRTQKTIIRKL